MFESLIQEFAELSPPHLDAVIAEAELAKRGAEARIAAAAAIVAARGSFRDHGYRSMKSYLKGTLNCSGTVANKIRKRSDLIDHEIYGDDMLRVEHRDEVVVIIEQWLAGYPDVDSAIARLEACDVPCAPILSVAQTVTHPHLVQRGTVRTVSDRLAGEFQIPGKPLRFSEFPEPLDIEAPTLGQHNREVLGQLLDKSDEEIDTLYADSVLHEREV